jgi:hypothetical protein
MLAAALSAMSISPGWAAGLQDENLLTMLPTGFVIGFTANQGPMTIMEYVPRGETVHDWTSMVTVQISHNLQKADPDTFVQAVSKRWIGSCENSGVQKLTSGAENGFPFTLWLMSCPLNPGTQKPENTFFKVISGDDSLYIVQYAFRSNLDPSKITPAMKYLKQVISCDTRRADRPCPAGLLNATPPPSPAK